VDDAVPQGLKPEREDKFLSQRGKRGATQNFASKFLPCVPTAPLAALAWTDECVGPHTGI
jgi:hypothetical protein